MVIAAKKREAGFTLMELIVVIAVISILVAIALPRFSAAIKSAKEAALKSDLHTMREAIDAYTADKEKAPQSLDDLVTAGYLREIPNDPMTSDKDWVTQTEDTLNSVDQTEPGIDDVHAGSGDAGSDGRPYSQW
jgi:general secretion pathway protein G